MSKIVLFEIQPTEFLDLGRASLNGNDIAIKIPKYGSLTLNELKTIQAFGDSSQTADWFRVALIRVNPEFADADLGEVPLSIIDKGYEWMLGELRQWKEPEPKEEEEKKPLTGVESSLDSGIFSQVIQLLPTLETAPSA